MEATTDVSSVMEASTDEADGMWNSSSQYMGITEVPKRSTISTSLHMSAAYLIIGFLCIFGNLVVIVVMGSNRKIRRRLINIYIINQSGIDLAVGVLMMAGYNMKGTVPYSGAFGQFYCMVWQSKVLLWGLLGSSMVNLIVLTLERYMELVHPIIHKNHFTRNRVVLSLIPTWLAVPVYRLFWVPTCIIQNGKCRIYADFPSESVQCASCISFHLWR